MNLTAAGPRRSNPLAAARRKGVVAVAARDGRLLVIQRSQSVEAPGAYCFPGGGVERGESESATICREMREELQVDVVPISPIYHSQTSWNVDLVWWQVQLLGSGVPTPNPREVEQVCWLAPAEILQLPQLLSSNRDFLAAWRRGEFELPGVVSNL